MMHNQCGNGQCGNGHTVMKMITPAFTLTRSRRICLFIFSSMLNFLLISQRILF